MTSPRDAMSSRVPIIMKTWAGDDPLRFEYISRSIPSLLRTRLPEHCEILIFNDASTDPQLVPYLESVAASDRRVRILTNETNKGPNWGQEDAFAFVETEYPDAPYFVNIDDDVLYNVEWLTRLLVARKDLATLGLDGVFTALNMPFRRPHAKLTTPLGEYLLKWKQPALNWLVPREVHAKAGPFIDEGIAYDTVYSHWLRLNHLPVICLSPSFVQNIGFKGAYAVDDTTTALDFIGEDDDSRIMSRLMHAAQYRLRRLPRSIQALADPSARPIAPVRWGAEWVLEGRARGGQAVAMFRLEEWKRLNWTLQAARARVLAVARVHHAGPAGILAVRESRDESSAVVECRFQFLPNLRELRRLRDGWVPPPSVLFEEILKQLECFHRARLVHNKLRRENIYVDRAGGSIHLAWYGVEPSSGIDFLADEAATVAILGTAVDRRVRPHIRERFAAAYLETAAPEILRGQEASLESDVYAAAALVVLSGDQGVATLAELRKKRAAWAAGSIGELPRGTPPQVASVLSRCLANEPAARYPDAGAVLKDISRLCHVS